MSRRRRIESLKPGDPVMVDDTPCIVTGGYRVTLDDGRVVVTVTTRPVYGYRRTATLTYTAGHKVRIHEETP